MRKIISIFLLSCLSLITYSQTRNYDQELANLLQKKYYFEARDYYEIYKDNIQTELVKNYYAITIYSFFSQDDKWEQAVDNFLDKKPKDLNTLWLFYNNIIEKYAALNKYEKAISYTDYVLNIIEKDSLKGYKDFIPALEGYKKNLMQEKATKHPDQEYINISKGKTSIPLKDEESLIIFQAKFNDKKANVLFDTGSSYAFFMQEKAANLLGVKYFQPNAQISQLNGMEVKFRNGYIESLNIGEDICFRNFPVLVIDKMVPENLDSMRTSAVDIVLDSFDVIIGLPAMKYWGNIELDFKKDTLNIYKKGGGTYTDSKSNMGIFEEKLLLFSKLNGVTFVPVLDTGYDTELYVNKKFASMHESKLPIDTLANKENINVFLANKLIENMSYEVIYNAEFKLSNRTKQIEKIHVVDEKDNPILLSRDGWLGFHFFKKNKLLLDFKNMIISYD